MPSRKQKNVYVYNLRFKVGIWIFRLCSYIYHRWSLTVPPAIELILEPGDGVPQGLVLLLLPFILLLPLLRRQLHVHAHRVLDGLRSGHKHVQESYQVNCIKSSWVKSKGSRIQSMCLVPNTEWHFFVSTHHWSSFQHITFVQTWGWIWSQTHCRRRASSRWRWWFDSSRPRNPAGYGSSCCLCRAHGFSTDGREEKSYGPVCKIMTYHFAIYDNCIEHSHVCIQTVNTSNVKPFYFFISLFSFLLLFRLWNTSYVVGGIMRGRMR